MAKTRSWASPIPNFLRPWCPPPLEYQTPTLPSPSAPMSRRAITLTLLSPSATDHLTHRYAPVFSLPKHSSSNHPIPTSITSPKEMHLPHVPHLIRVACMATLCHLGQCSHPLSTPPTNQILWLAPYSSNHSDPNLNHRDLQADHHRKQDHHIPLAALTPNYHSLVHFLPPACHLNHSPKHLPFNNVNRLWFSHILLLPAHNKDPRPITQ